MEAFIPQVPRISSFTQKALHPSRRTGLEARKRAFSKNGADHRRLYSPKKRTRVACAPVAQIDNTTDSNRAHIQPLRVAVLVSGGGRSLENLCESIQSGALSGCTISVVIASKKTAGAIIRAEKHAIPARVVRLKDFDGVTEQFSDAISGILDEFEVDLVIMAGWMHFYRIPTRYDGKVINIHPSLIPAFCGKGFYGNRVHEAVLNFGAKMTGCTVHLADNKYDHGPIILQKAVPVLDTDTADELAARVFESEKEALPEAVQLFVDGRLSNENGVIKRTQVSQSSRV